MKQSRCRWWWEDRTQRTKMLQFRNFLLQDAGCRKKPPQRTNSLGRTRLACCGAGPDWS